MDFDLVVMEFNCRKAEVPESLWRKAVQFSRMYSNNKQSNSKCGHLGDGWFIIYDYPLAERWARECSWNAFSHRCHDVFGDLVPNDYTLVHFSDPKGAVEMKLRWG